MNQTESMTLCFCIDMLVRLLKDGNLLENEETEIMEIAEDLVSDDYPTQQKAFVSLPGLLKIIDCNLYASYSEATKQYHNFDFSWLLPLKKDQLNLLRGKNLYEILPKPVIYMFLCANDCEMEILSSLGKALLNKDIQKLEEISNSQDLKIDLLISVVKRIQESSYELQSRRSARKEQYF